MPTCERCRTTELVRGKRSTFPGVCVACYKQVRNTVDANNKRGRRHGTIGKIRTFDWLSILAANSWKCSFCQARHGDACGKRGVYLTLDHVYPLSRGGMNNAFNIQALCQSCHKKKDCDPDLMPWDFDKVMNERERKNKSQNFFHHLMNTFAHRTPEFFLKLRQEYDILVQNGEEDDTFGAFVIHHILVLYTEARNEQREATQN